MAQKLESDDLSSPDTISATTSQAIMKARQNKGWTQADLAKQINEKQTVVTDYENGRAIPENRILAAMERALGCKLPRAPKAKKAKKKLYDDDDDY